MAEIYNQAIEKNPFKQVGTRVPSDLEADLLDIAKRERRSMSQVISLLLSEYMPIRKRIVEHKLKHFDIPLDYRREDNKIIFEARLVDAKMLNIEFLDTKELFTINITKDESIDFAANLLTFLIELKINE